MKKDRGAGSILIVAEIIALVVVVVFGAVKCVRGPEEPKQTYTARKPDTEEKEVDLTEEAVPETETEAQPEKVTVTFSEEVLAQVAAMTNEEKVAQLFLTSPESLTQNSQVTIAGQGTRAALERYPIAGLVYSRANFQGSTQIGALLSGGQRYNMEVNGTYLLLAAIGNGTDGEQRLAVSSLYDAGPLAAVITENQMQGNEENILYPVSYPKDMEQITADMPYVILAVDPAQMAESVAALRSEAQYQGVVITTDLASDAVMAQYPDGDAAVQALLAGADLLYQSDNFTVAYQNVLEAVENGTVSMECIDEAVARILTVKSNMPQPTEGDIMAEEEQTVTTNQNRTTTTNPPVAQAPVEQPVQQNPQQQDNNAQQNAPAQNEGQQNQPNENQPQPEQNEPARQEEQQQNQNENNNLDDGQVENE